MDWITEPQAWISLLTLTGLEIVLGIDNIIFISILAGKLPADQQARARQTGLMLALITRILLLCSLAWMVKLTAPFLTFLGFALSGRDLILLGGGLFLIWKSTREIHEKLEGAEEHAGPAKVTPQFGAIIGQILLLDIVFSIDSILTAVGMTDDLPVMIVAVLVAVGLMMVAANPLAEFIARNPSVVMLALAFLLMIGMVLIADGFGVHVPKGYIYAAMAFSALVEGLNMLSRRSAAADGGEAADH